MPGDHALAVGGVKHHLLRLRQARRGGRRAKALGKILHRALPEIEQRDDGAVAEEHEDHEPLEGVHCPVIPRRLYGHLSKLTVAPRARYDARRQDEFVASIQAQSFHTPSYTETGLIPSGFALTFNGRGPTDSKCGAGVAWPGRLDARLGERSDADADVPVASRSELYRQRCASGEGLRTCFGGR